MERYIINGFYCQIIDLNKRSKLNMIKNYINRDNQRVFTNLDQFLKHSHLASGLSYKKIIKPDTEFKESTQKSFHCAWKTH